MVVYCHGWPSSRLEAAIVGDLPVRLIAADRPGYGQSDPHPQGTLADRAADVAVLADHLGLDRFPVVGVSGGGPLAAACAYHLVPRVAALTLISAVPPPEHVIGPGMEMLIRIGRRPRAARAVMTLARLLVRSRLGETVVLGRSLPPLDAAVMTPPRRVALLAAMREGLRPGISGALADARLYGSPWGFRLQDIAVPTTIWHGTNDQLVDISASRAYGLIPGAVLRIGDGDGHYSLALGRTVEIMEDLLARTAAAS